MKALTACCNVYKAFMCALGCASTTITIARGMTILGHIDTHNLLSVQLYTDNRIIIYRNDGAVSCTFALGSTANPGTSDIQFFGYWR